MSFHIDKTQGKLCPIFLETSCLSQYERPIDRRVETGCKGANGTPFDDVETPPKYEQSCCPDQSHMARILALKLVRMREKSSTDSGMAWIAMNRGRQFKLCPF